MPALKTGPQLRGFKSASAPGLAYSPNQNINILFARRHGACHDLHASGEMDSLFLLGKVTVCPLRAASRRVAATSELRCLPARASRHGIKASPEIPQQAGPALFAGTNPLTREPVCTQQEVLHESWS